MNIKQKSNKFRSIVNDMADLYEKKNSNYGDSFGQLFEELGPTAGLVPLWNKLHRATSLIKGNKNNFESLEDTFKDLACYAIMNLIEMEAQKDIEIDTFKELKEYIIYLKSIGLRGLETQHVNLSQEERYVYHEFCKELDLLESGGTDYHGIDIKPDIEIGSGRKGNIFTNNFDIINSLFFGKEINLEYTYNEELLEKLLNDIGFPINFRDICYLDKE